MRALSAVVLVGLGMLAAGCGQQRCNGKGIQCLIDSYRVRQPIQLAMAADADAARTDAPDPRATWLAMASDIERQSARLANDAAVPADADVAASQPGAVPAGAAGTYADWRTRTGPAYPGDFWRSMGRDAKEFPAVLWDDTKAAATNPWSVAGILVAGVSGIAINGAGCDETVADHYREHGSQLNTFWDSVGDAGGNPGTHFALAGAAYLWSLQAGDTKTYEVSKTMLSALTLNGLTTMGLKAATRTESPNGDEFGWPSGHTSSSFTVATVLAKYYGPWVGVPAFALASYVGYERIDARNHDFSDVVSGGLIGMAIGYAVAQNHMPRVMGMDLIPYATPDGGAGLALYGKK